MTKRNYLMAILVVFSTLGCSLGFVPTILNPPKHTLEYWEKAGMTLENRLADGAQCGGGHTVVTGFSPEMLEAARRPEETTQQARTRLFYDWQRCMLRKGYHSTQPCYDSQISRSSPACGAP